MARVGYIWTGPLEHNANFQRDILRKRGVDFVLEDISDGSRTSRRALTTTLDRLVSGDTLVVWRLDRLGNSLPNILALLDLLGHRKIAVFSVTEDMDTLDLAPTPLLRVVSAFNEVQRSLARERTLAGIYAARARGHVGGRPRALSSVNIERAIRMKEQGAPVREIALELGTSRATVYRALARAQEGAADPSATGGIAHDRRAKNRNSVLPSLDPATS